MLLTKRALETQPRTPMTVLVWREDEQGRVTKYLAAYKDRFALKDRVYGVYDAKRGGYVETPATAARTPRI